MGPPVDCRPVGVGRSAGQLVGQKEEGGRWGVEPDWGNHLLRAPGQYASYSLASLAAVAATSDASSAALPAWSALALALELALALALVPSAAVPAAKEHPTQEWWTVQSQPG